MKKLLPFFIIVVFAVFGCGPKFASQETLDSLEHAKLAAESAESKAKSLEAKRLRLERKRLGKQDELSRLQAELEGGE